MKTQKTGGMADVLDLQEGGDEFEVDEEGDRKLNIIFMLRVNFYY